MNRRSHQSTRAFIIIVKNAVTTSLYFCRTPSDYYAFEILKDVNLSEDQIKAHWEKVPEKKKKQIVAEHKKKAEEYRQKMEKFIRVRISACFHYSVGMCWKPLKILISDFSHFLKRI